MMRLGLIASYTLLATVISFPVVNSFYSDQNIELDSSYTYSAIKDYTDAVFDYSIYDLVEDRFEWMIGISLFVVYFAESTFDTFEVVINSLTGQTSWFDFFDSIKNAWFNNYIPSGPGGGGIRAR
jgi:hypothetical protein